jgi:hypothetical protein
LSAFRDQEVLHFVLAGTATAAATAAATALRFLAKEKIHFNEREKKRE